jgi:hypothetical protein
MTEEVAQLKCKNSELILENARVKEFGKIREESQQKII